ncbi:MAG: serine hydrolase [Myxococcota bacterium]
MNTKHLIVSTTAAGLALLAVPPRVALANDFCTPVPFDAAGFSTVIEQQLAGVKGYSVAISKDGAVVANVNGGVAADGVDTPTPIPMDGSTPGNIGSTAKMLSTVALLQAFEDDPGATVEQWLNRYIVDYFPQPWRDRVLDPASPPAVRDVEYVTFRDILGHRSGLAQSTTFIDHGIDYGALATNTYAYSNGNFSVIGYMFPYIVDPALGAAIDADLAGQFPTQGGLFSEYTAPFFGDYLQQNMFDHVTVSVGPGVSVPYGLWSDRLEPSCNHKQSYAQTPYFRDLHWGTADDRPLVGDVDGDGRDDLIVWRPSSGRWYTRTVEGVTITSGLTYGDDDYGDVPLTGDVNADGHSDYVIWRESTGDWYVRSAAGPTLVNGLHYGTSGDVPLVGNVGGNASDDLVVWRPSNGRWYATQSNGLSLLSGVTFGTSGDVPHLGDINGDGVAELVIWRPSTGQWFARDVTTGSTIVSGLQWGLAGDQSLLGDADGDGTQEFIIFRPSTGDWYARDADGEYFREVYWGAAEISGAGPLHPLTGDFAGDFKDKLTLFRPSNGYWSAAGRRYALGYDDAADQGPGSPAPFIPEPPGCYGQGGYWMSSLEFAGWTAALAQGEFISLALLDSLFDPTSSTTRSERLGWSTFSSVPSFIDTNYGVDYLPWQAGGDHDFRSAIIELPDGYFGVGFMNDGDAPGPTAGTVVLKNALIDAWIEAVDLDCES